MPQTVTARSQAYPTEANWNQNGREREVTDFNSKGMVQVQTQADNGMINSLIKMMLLRKMDK
jgi:hypothetical protein